MGTLKMSSLSEPQQGFKGPITLLRCKTVLRGTKYLGTQGLHGFGRHGDCVGAFLPPEAGWSSPEYPGTPDSQTHSGVSGRAAVCSDAAAHPIQKSTFSHFLHSGPEHPRNNSLGS